VARSLEGHRDLGSLTSRRAGGWAAARVALGSFWALRGAFTVAWPAETQIVLAEVTRLRGAASLRSLAVGLGVLQLSVALGLASRHRAASATTGAAMTGLMLLGVLSVYGKLVGTSCGCLRFLGVGQFGPANVLVLLASTVSFTLLSVRRA
jgi:hypothetical protein